MNHTKVLPMCPEQSVTYLPVRSRDIKKQFERFCVDNRGFSKAETDGGWVKIFVSPYPLGLIEEFELFAEDDLENLLSLSQKQLHIMRIDSAPIT